MERREKFLIVLITIVILLGIFIAFIVSNSEKTPPEVLIQNEEKKTAEAVLGGYTWKVFGNNIIADAVDLKTIDYPSDNTIVSKTGEVLTLSTTEKFTVQEIVFLETISNQEIEAITKTNEVASYFTVNAPMLEGTYLCLFKLEYDGKGTAEYAVRVVITDENIYDVKEIIEYKNTAITDITAIKAILTNLPYSDALSGITINTVDIPKSLNIKFANLSIDRDDLINSSVALFTLIPDLDFISYETNSLEEDIYYSRDEINNLMDRNVLEYAENSELWLREVIYKDQNFKSNNYVTIYSSVISSSLANLSEKEIGKYVAIDINENNVSGEIILNEFDKKELLKRINNEYESVLMVNGNEYEKQGGTILYVTLTEKLDETTYLVNVRIESADNKNYTYTYKATMDGNTVGIDSYVENSGDQE